MLSHHGGQGLLSPAPYSSSLLLTLACCCSGCSALSGPCQLPQLPWRLVFAVPSLHGTFPCYSWYLFIPRDQLSTCQLLRKTLYLKLFLFLPLFPIQHPTYFCQISSNRLYLLIFSAYCQPLSSKRIKMVPLNLAPCLP